MGAMSDDFIARQENICEEYCAMRLTFEEALSRLIRMGFDPHEARDLLQESAR